jgi:ketopantoate hydroxymethyltransferase
VLTAYMFTCMAYFSTTKMEAVDSSEMSVNYHQSTCSHSLEDSILHSDCLENLKFHIVNVCIREEFTWP